MSLTNQQLVKLAFQRAGLIDETQEPTAVQAANGLGIANGYFLTQAVDGLRLGWWPQSNLAAPAPLREGDFYDACWLLAEQIAINYERPITDPAMIANIDAASMRLTKRSILFTDSDLSELSRAQAGGPFGAPNWG